MYPHYTYYYPHYLQTKVGWSLTLTSELHRIFFFFFSKPLKGDALNLELARVCMFYVPYAVNVVSGSSFGVGGARSRVFMVKVLKMLKLPGRIAVTSSRCPISPSVSEQRTIGVSLFRFPPH